MAKKGSWAGTSPLNLSGGGGLWKKQILPKHVLPDLNENEIAKSIVKMKNETDAGLPGQIEAAFPGMGGISMHPPGFFTIEVREIREWQRGPNFGINPGASKSVTRLYQIPLPGNTSSP